MVFVEIAEKAKVRETAWAFQLKLVTCVVYSDILRSIQKIRSDLFTMARWLVCFIQINQSP